MEEKRAAAVTPVYQLTYSVDSDHKDTRLSQIPETRQRPTAQYLEQKCLGSGQSRAGSSQETVRKVEMVQQMLTPLSNLGLSECQKVRVESQFAMVPPAPEVFERSNTSSVVASSSSFLKRKKKMLEEQILMYEPVEEEDPIDTHYMVTKTEGPCKSSFTEFNHF